VSNQALEPTQPPVQWVPGVLSPGVKRGRDVTLTTHPHLVPRSRRSRSYTSSPPRTSMAWSRTASLYMGKRTVLCVVETIRMCACREQYSGARQQNSVMFNLSLRGKAISRCFILIKTNFSIAHPRCNANMLVESSGASVVNFEFSLFCFQVSCQIHVIYVVLVLKNTRLV
jgi:hypothetical protein